MLFMCMETVKRVLRNPKGQGMAEYGLILALVAVVAAAAFTFMEGGIDTLIRAVGTKLTGQAGQ